MFTQSARYYDAIYAWKDYEGEARRIHELVARYGRSGGAALLDVACGTGAHLAHLRHAYTVEGLDLDEALLEVARAKLPGIPFHQGDMLDFDLGRQFDAVVCLFSAIGYVRTADNLRKAVANLSRHVLPGGVLIVEPWFRPGDMQHRSVHGHYVDEPDLKIARLNVTEIEGTLSILGFHYLVATPAGVEHFAERHEIGLFTHEEYVEAFRLTGLDTIHDPAGLMGRGLYIGLRGI
jgi:SAM-dependent methyltransferase